MPLHLFGQARKRYAWRNDCLHLPTPQLGYRPLALSLSPFALITAHSRGSQSCRNQTPDLLQVVSQVTTLPPKSDLALKCCKFLYCYFPYFHDSKTMLGPVFHFLTFSPKGAIFFPDSGWRAGFQTGPTFASPSPSLEPGRGSNSVMDGWHEGLRKWDQEKRDDYNLFSLVPECGRGRGMTGQTQGCASLGHSPFWS